MLPSPCKLIPIHFPGLQSSWGVDSWSVLASSFGVVKHPAAASTTKITMTNIKRSSLVSNPEPFDDTSQLLPLLNFPRSQRVSLYFSATCSFHSSFPMLAIFPLMTLVTASTSLVSLAILLFLLFYRIL